MDSLSNYRKAIERVLTVYTSIPYAHGDLRCEAIFDREHDRYTLITLGWNAGKQRALPSRPHRHRGRQSMD